MRIKSYPCIIPADDSDSYWVLNLIYLRNGTVSLVSNCWTRIPAVSKL